ncbi:hypothetical protein NDU88_005728 [Pleurodeles waltl]|uniref:Uncharacterized protein n=1 Tax=Pleurodeles waltl TaxID=8319 RepID=A0AAV7W8M5_PLEWA|nr:hypothetical protein NDU88_005728 [Pleurodeles waltl]
MSHSLNVQSGWPEIRSSRRSVPIGPEREERLEEGEGPYERPETDVLSDTPDGGVPRTEDQSLAASHAATEGAGGGDNLTVSEEGGAQSHGVGRYNLRPRPMPSCRLRDFVPL